MCLFILSFFCCLYYLRLKCILFRNFWIICFILESILNYILILLPSYLVTSNICLTIIQILKWVDNYNIMACGKNIIDKCMENDTKKIKENSNRVKIISALREIIIFV